MSVSPALHALASSAPLGPAWSCPELYEDSVQIGALLVQVVGLSARHADGDEAIGSAASVCTPAVERAYFELFERAVTLDALRAGVEEHELRDASGRVIGNVARDAVFPNAPTHADWRYARSNGIAAHTSWEAACRAARLELFERDRVLRSWFGGPRPRVQPIGSDSLLAKLSHLYEIIACTLPATGSALAISDADPVVAGVVLFPRSRSLPLAQGFAARFTLDQALTAAAQECLQVLAFLWDEPLPTARPAPRSDPGFHQDYYLHAEQHERLRAWLAGAHATTGSLRVAAPELGRVGFVDLTPPAAKRKMFVAKALPTGELPLTFGPGHPHVRGPIPEVMRVHPIA